MKSVPGKICVCLLFKLVWKDPIIYVCVMFVSEKGEKGKEKKRKRGSQRELLRDKNEKRE